MSNNFYELLGDITLYIKDKEQALQKQASIIDHYMKKESAYMQKVSGIVDTYVESGDIPAYLSEPIKRHFVEDPIKFAEFLESRSHGVRQPIGSGCEGHPNHRQFGDALEQFAYGD